MVRQLDTAQLRGSTKPARAVASSTGRAVGAALACLLVTSLVVERSVAAIQPWDTSAGTAFGSGSIELTDDDQGRSLVDLEAMAPGRPQSSCINVTYTGTVVPVDITMTVDVLGELTDYVTVTLARGRNGSFDDCDGFEPLERLFSGTLAELGAGPLALSTLRGSDETTSYRFIFDLIDTADAVDKSASADIFWDAIPS